MTIFGFSYDDFLNTVSVTVDSQVMTDADGEAVGVYGVVPVEALAPATLVALTEPLEAIARRVAAGPTWQPKAEEPEPVAEGAVADADFNAETPAELEVKAPDAVAEQGDVSAATDSPAEVASVVDSAPEVSPEPAPKPAPKKSAPKH